MSITVIPIRIPQSQGRVAGGPRESDAMTEGSGGHTKVNANWSYPLWAYTLRYIRENNDTYDGFISLLSFFTNYHDKGFLYKDPWDCDADGTGKIVQVGSDWRLVKDYLGAEPRRPNTAYECGEYVRPLVSNGYYYVATVAGTTTTSEPSWPTSAGTVTDGSVTWKYVGTIPYKRRLITRPIEGTIVFSGDGTLSYTTGVLAGRTDGATTWTGNFDVPCQFVSTEPSFDRDPGGYAEWADVQIREVRV